MGSHFHKVSGTICNWDQNFWSMNVYLDHLIWTEYVADSLIDLQSVILNFDGI